MSLIYFWMLMALLLSFGFSEAFLPVVSTKLNNRCCHLALSVDNEFSEWYSPPPPKKSFSMPGRGQVALQTEITSEAELDSFLNNGDDRLVVVKFYSEWCKSCQKVTQKVDKLAKEQADWFSQDGSLVKKGNLRIANIEHNTARDLFHKMAIKRLPTMQLYFPKDGKLQKVQEFPCAPGQFHVVEDLVASYVKHQAMTCKRNNQSKTKNFDLETTLENGGSLVMEHIEREKGAKSKFWSLLRGTSTP